MNDQDPQFKLCACGCGKSVTRQASLFINGHNRRGIKRTNKSLEKAKQTNILKYGSECVFQSSNIKEKIKQTCLKKYGTENPYQSEEIQNKYKRTCLSKYGVANPSQLNTVKEKSKKTCLLKYGTEFSFQSAEVREKRKNTMLTKYGTEHALQKIDFLDKSKETCKKHHGNQFPLQSDIIKDKMRSECKDKGMTWINQTAISRKKLRISAIKRIENQAYNGEPMMPTIGSEERIFLNELQKYTDYEIIRNDPSFRYDIGRYPDGHICELKLFIQFDERYHFKDNNCTKYQDDDIRCSKDLESIPGYRILRISEKEWKENQDSVIQNFKKLLVELKESKLICNE